MTLVPNLAKWFALMLPMRDGPDHRFLRRLVAAAFTPRKLSHLEEYIANRVDNIIHEGLAAGELDVVSEVALPLPIELSAIMLGVPIEDQRQVRDWVLLVHDQFFSYGQDAAVLEHVERQLSAFGDYVRSLRERSRLHPSDDAMCYLAAAADSGEISEDELIAYVLMLFSSGLEPLAAALTMGIWEMLQHPDAIPIVAQERSYAEAVFQEAIRLHSPVRFSARAAICPIAWEEHQLKQDDVVVFFYSAANRDRRYFPEPETFDPLRIPRRDVGFGYGAHYCLGAPLAMLAGSIALERFARFANEIEVATEPSGPDWSASLPYSTLDRLPIRRR